MKTLYVTDLDGTLMKNDETLSAYTVQMINELIEKGMAFTYATARSIESAVPITGGLKMKLPAITRNGAVLADNTTGKHLEKAVFTAEEAEMLKQIPELPYYGFVSCFLGEVVFGRFLVFLRVTDVNQPYASIKVFNGKPFRKLWLDERC